MKQVQKRERTRLRVKCGSCWGTTDPCQHLPSFLDFLECVLAHVDSMSGHKEEKGKGKKSLQGAKLGSFLTAKGEYLPGAGARW